jgi:hypothetical protein
VPSYLVETYLPRGRISERVACDRRASRSAEQLTREHVPVRFEQSIYVPEDEICFFVFDAPSALIAERIARRAGLDPVRTVEADSSRKENQK